MNSEELAAKATIAAANIQADITLQAAYINGVAIVIGIFLSWMTALHIQKVSRLAETRRNVYLELMQSFSEMHSAFHAFINKEEDGNILFEKINKFGVDADKASFVAETSTKREIYKFLEFFRENSEIVGPFIVDYIDANDNFKNRITLHSSAVEDLNNRKDYLEEIRLNNPNDIRIAELIGIVERKIEESEIKMNAVNEAFEDLKLKKGIAKEQIVIFLDSINDLALPISHKLRSELGAKTDIKLDYSIHNSQKK